jgi:hypothetical protein
MLATCSKQPACPPRSAASGGSPGCRWRSAAPYLRNAMRKLGTHGRMETVVTARRLGHLP